MNGDGEGGTAVRTLDIERIMEMIPHRYPFLMIDRMIDVVPGVAAVGIKNVSVNEPHFQGHFPRQAVMPGVLVIEAMAQSAAALVVATLGRDAEGKLVYFMSVDRARFRKPVTPGDVMYVEVRKLRRRGSVWKFSGEARVADATVAEATFGAMILDH